MPILFGGWGVDARQLLGDNYNKIIVQSGNKGILAYASNGATPFGNKDLPSSLPYRIIVECLD